MATRNLVRHHGSKTLFVGIPMGLARDGQLSAAARSVALYVWSHDEKWNQSAAEVAEALQMSRNTVAGALASLEARGWLVREIHRAAGKQKPTGEVWHLQLSNTPFTATEAEALAGTCSEIEQVPAQKLSTPPAQKLSTIEVHGRSAPEVHSVVVHVEPAQKLSRSTEDPWTTPAPAWGGAADQEPQPEPDPWGDPVPATSTADDPWSPQPQLSPAARQLWRHIQAGGRADDTAGLWPQEAVAALAELQRLSLV
ncbi:helix-turn-helix domain-containing protein [Mycobacteriaceae bacterium Msp059]|nr:helix-turn-helix domain-containing protein [Mycobacteriaceae bacterium Msp059]